ncbi:F0F1 ATP synthase subunit alpha [Cardinium endosymbiont of Culicoides punctatus]|uniref:F0F1 ATP synthase subunit alpha n=1 Tax=Cardinium endosymbiont of Culicoides punctatus TaxID=2304601 RepID=UPI0010585D60|nr:F0F1 ATP synthase subunit alpha [Cardinium endosymbiont of Culicoides punctatus]TDG95366.1 ATP synthase subunit alpha [Cardinium endosymbiont of Culicoides punctatus]
MAQINTDAVTAILNAQLSSFKTEAELEETGTVIQSGDGVVRIHGLFNVQAGELLVFENGQKGLALNLEETMVGAVILDDASSIKEGDTVTRTKRVASIQVGDGLLGRVLNTLGEPIDGNGPILGPCFEMPLERNAPGVIYRQPVNTPLQTGLKAIDAMIPIGKGQRELIIGDRQSGKTSIALDTIINQKKLFDKGKPVYCIYVAIGQKASSVANIVDTLIHHGAMSYTTIIAATSATSATMQSFAPFAGAAIGEFFRDTGRDALIIYDDLSKQAVAYRELSLLLRRPPGREAFPGDVFYLHARLLERAASIVHNDKMASSMNDIPDSLKGMVKGGGSLTALPIIETQMGDVSAYIPTNVISITDGQIFLEMNLFNSGIKPAINVGISVSRIGSAAQIKGMKKVASTLKLDQAQFAELETFAKFSSDLEPSTKRAIDRGRKNQELLKQNLHTPMAAEEQVAILCMAMSGYLDPVPLELIKTFEKQYLELLRLHHAATLASIADGKWDNDILNVLIKATKGLLTKYAQN